MKATDKILSTFTKSQNIAFDPIEFIAKILIDEGIDTEAKLIEELKKHPNFSQVYKIKLYTKIDEINKGMIKNVPNIMKLKSVKK